MILGKIELLKWNCISSYDDKTSPMNVLLRCPINGIYIGWLDDMGWRDVANPDHLSEPMDPQPKYYIDQGN